MDSRLKHRLLHDVPYYKVLEVDDYGDIEHADPEDLKAYRHGKVSMITDLEGKEVVSTKQLIIDTIWPVTHGDEVLFDGVRQKVKGYSHYDGLKPGTGTTVLYL